LSLRSEELEEHDQQFEEHLEKCEATRVSSAASR
jgi:hypothetical protein